MKAYEVYDTWNPDNGCTIVFGETAGKAKSAALHTDVGEDSLFVDIRAYRVPTLDSYYRGRIEMDWDNPDERIAMVKEANMHCQPWTTEADDCKKCPAREYCSLGEDLLGKERSEADE